MADSSSNRVGQTTTTFSDGSRTKPFAWSYSRLKNFEACPKKHYHVDVRRDVKEPESEALLWGNLVHKSAAARLSRGVALPDGMDFVARWCDRIVYDGVTRDDSASPVPVVLVEQQLAIKADFSPCEWFAKDAWFRGVADVIKIQGPVALAIDWKTGKIKEDGVQLALVAACIFAHHPEVQSIRTYFVWVAETAETRANFARHEMPAMWKAVWPRMQQLEHAYSTTQYPAKPGGLCKRWCPVDSCPHHGE